LSGGLNKWDIENKHNPPKYGGFFIVKNIHIFQSFIVRRLYLYQRLFMGRKKIYKTEEEQSYARSQRNKRYYDKHKQQINEIAMQRYWKKLGKKMP